MHDHEHHHEHDNEDVPGSLGEGRRGPFGRRGFRPPFGPGGRGHGFGGPSGGRARRGDVPTGVLRLLSEEPMHGYQILQELAKRSGGVWRPSPGSVYPTLQMLEDEGLVASEETGGKRVYRLTEAGRTSVAEKADQPAPWDEAADAESASTGDLRESAGRLMQAARQIAVEGSTDQAARAAKVLTDARKQLYAILAED